MGGKQLVLESTPMDRKLKITTTLSGESSPWHLPPLWQIIYNEGIHANHILFDRSDLLLFETSLAKNHLAMLSPEEAKLLEETFLDLISCHSVGLMRQTISGLDSESRVKIFQLYKHLLQYWTDFLKKSLN
jgi:hypothetical protein